MIRKTIVGILLAAFVVGCAEEAPPYKPGEGKTPPPPPSGQQTGQGMPVEGH